MKEAAPYLRKNLLEIPIPGILKSDRPCRFALATDSHFARKEDLDDKCYSDAVLKLEEFVRVANASHCDFAIHLGDFKDEDLIPKESSTLRYLEEMEAAFSQFEGPRLHCLGNHDLDSITKRQFLDGVQNSGIKSEMGYYTFDLKGIRFVVLDANFDADGKDHFFKEGGDWQKPVIPQKELDWLRHELEKSPHPCILFVHHPLFAYVKNGYSYHVLNHPEVRSLLESSGKVLAVFNGHMHEEMFHEINGIWYLAMNSMLEGTFVQRNCFYTVEIGTNKIGVTRFERESPLT